MDVKVISGRPTATSTERTTSLAKFSVRPQRLAFIIHTSLGRKQIEEIILYNTWVWGGFYNVFVPCSPRGITRDYLRLLMDYDPDRLVFCGRVPVAVRNDLFNRIQPFNAVNLKSILPTNNDPRDFVKNVSTPQVLVREANSLKGESSSSVRFPNIAKADPFRPYALAHLGLLDDGLRKFNEHTLKAKRVDFLSGASLHDYLFSMDECLRHSYPLRLTRSRLHPTLRMEFSGDAVIAFGDPHDVEGICMFWNWRMDASDGFSYPPHDAFAFLPPQSVKTKEGITDLATWIQTKHQHGHITLVAPPTLKVFLRGLKTRLRPLLGSDFTHIKTVSTASHIPITQCPESEVTKEIGWAGNETVLEAPLPEFDPEWLNDEAWVVDCDFSDFRTGKQSYFPPRRKGQMEVLLRTTYGAYPPMSVRGGPWRFSRQAVACLSSSKERLFRLRLPEPESIFDSILSQAGYKSRLSDKCQYIRSATDILNKATQLDKLQRKGFRNLFYSMADSTPLTQDQIKTLVKPGKDSKELDDFLMSMLASSGLFRGVTYRCPSCGLASWHQVASLEEIMTCPGCTRTFQPPLEFFYSFKMSTLLDTTVKQGGIPVILTEGVLRSLARKTFYIVPGVIAKDSTGAEVDIDILASCDGHVVCAECKTLDKKPKSSSITEIVRQLERDYDVAARLDADVFAISLLSNDVPNKIWSFIRRKNRRRRGPFSIVITLDDMERGYLLGSCVTPNPQGGKNEPCRDIVTLLRLAGFRVD